MIVESADDAIKEFGSKHQEKKVQLREWKRRAEQILPPETIEELRKRAEGTVFRQIFPRRRWLQTVFVLVIASMLLGFAFFTVSKTALFGDSSLLSKASPSPSSQNLNSDFRVQTKSDNSVATPSPLISPSPIPSSSPSENWQELSIAEGRSQSFFGGDVLISLIQTSLEGDPLRQKVFANIGSPNGRDFRIERKDIGYSFYYETGVRYQIRITGADISDARFLVVRIK